MYDVLLAAHLILAVFAVGPLVHAATTAARGVRTGDATAMASAARTVRIYSGASVLVVVAGFALLSQNSPYHKGQKVGEISQPWVWVSLLLWLAAVGVALGVVAPALSDGKGSTVRTRVGAGGGVVAVLFAVIIVLMVYRPGQ